MALNPDDYPVVALVSNDQKHVYLADGTEVGILELAIAYNELRDALCRDLSTAQSISETGVSR